MILRQNTDWETATSFITKLKHCNIITSTPVFRYEEFEYYTCSCTHSQSYLVNWFSMYHAYKNGCLPFKGGYYDQPALIDDIFSICQAYISKKENDDLAKNNKK